MRFSLCTLFTLAALLLGSTHIQAQTAQAPAGAVAQAEDDRVGYRWDATNTRNLAVGLDSSAPIELILTGEGSDVSKRAKAAPTTAALAGVNYTYAAVFSAVPPGIYKLEIPDQGRTFTAYIDLRSAATAEGHPSPTPFATAPQRAMASAAKGPVTMFTGAAGIYANFPVSWFDPQVYQKTVRGKTEYWVKDVAPPDKDPRTHYYFMDGFGIGSKLDYGPIVRGGIYMVRCTRFSGEWFQKGSGIETHTMWIKIPGPLMELGDVRVPPGFQPGATWQDEHVKLLPEYAPVKDKVSVSYIRSTGEKEADLYKHGATHITYASDPNKNAYTTSVELPPAWRGTIPCNVSEGEIQGNNIGEVGFRSLTEKQLQDVADLQPKGGLWFSDLERGDPTYYWSIPLEEATLPNYYKLYEMLRAGSTTRLVGDYYRVLYQSKGFHSHNDGMPKPLEKRFAESIEHPESQTQAAYRTFNLDGKKRSLRDVINIYTADAYPDSWTPDRIADQNMIHALYHIYSLTFDIIQERRIIPKDAKIVTFGWTQTDGDAPGSRLYIPQPNGKASYVLRSVTPAWWAQTASMLSMIVGDGMNWWTEGIVNGNDPKRLSPGDGDPRWEPTNKGAASPFVEKWQGTYPRHPFYNYTWGKLGEYQVKQVEDTLTEWNFAPYKLDGKTSFTPVKKHADAGANKAATILTLAEERKPIVIISGKAGKRSVFAVHPFGDWRETYKLSVSVDGRMYEMEIGGKWPSLQRLPF